LTVLPARARHHVPHRIADFSQTNFEEIDMSEHIGSIFAGIAFAATFVVVSVGTAAMCFPGLVA
jgi:hypothetical protein